MSQEKEDLKPIIQAVAERIHYAESRRTNFTVIAGIFIAGGLALLGLLTEKVSDALIWYPLVFGAVYLIILGVGVFWVYSRQTNRYPWTSATKTWKWFYRDALPEQGKFDTRWQTYFGFKNEKTRIQGEYRRQLPLFKDQIGKLEKPIESYNQDVEQLYVLHINEKYKNIHLSELRTVLNRGLFGCLIFLLAGLLIGYCADSRAIRTHNFLVKNDSLMIEVQWQEIQNESLASELLLNVTATNKRDEAIPLPDWCLTDKSGLRVPITTIMQDNRTNVLAPQQETKYAVIVRSLSIADLDSPSLCLEAR